MNLSDRLSELVRRHIADAFAVEADDCQLVDAAARVVSEVLALTAVAEFRALESGRIVITRPGAGPAYSRRFEPVSARLIGNIAGASNS